MKKDIYKTVTHEVTERVKVDTKLYCDVCKKEITTNYWELTTHHNDWGNDSCESYEYKDVCSKECMQKEFDEYMKDSNNDFNSMKFEIEHYRI